MIKLLILCYIWQLETDPIRLMNVFIPATRATGEVYQDVIVAQAFLGDSCQRSNCAECSPNCQRMSWHICEEWRERIEDKFP